MRVFKRGLAAFLAAMLLLPSEPAMAAIQSTVDVETQVSVEAEKEISDSEEESETEKESTEESSPDPTEDSADETLLDEDNKEAEETETPAEETEETETPAEDVIVEDSTDDAESSADADIKADFDKQQEADKKTDADTEHETIADKVLSKVEEIKEQVIKTFEIRKPAEKNMIASSNNAERKTGDRVGFNTGDHVWYVVDEEDSDNGLGDAFFEKDGSYTINIGDNPFFPYEVQFTYNGRTTNHWFMTPDDSVVVGGHTFYVDAYFDGTVVTQMSLEVGGDVVVVYPEKKKFTDDGDGAALMSLLPLEEKPLTVDLTGYTPVDLTKVSVDYIFGNDPLKDTDKVMWAYEKDGDDYSISQSGDMIDLSHDTCYGDPDEWQMIVGEDNQLNMDNVRYLVKLRVKASRNWLVPNVYKQNEDGSREKVSVSSSHYRDYMDDSRELEIWVPREELDWKTNPYISLEVNESIFPNGTTRYSDLKVYKGKTIDANADITEQILARDMTVKDSGYLLSGDDSWITLAAYGSSGNLMGCLPVKVDLYRNSSDNTSNWLSFGGLYDMADGNWKGVSYSSYSDNLGDEEYDPNSPIKKRAYTYSLGYEYAPDKEYYLQARYYKGNIDSPSSVTAAYVGQYSSIAQAVAAGAADIKGSLFGQKNGGGYKANYSTGVYFTVFVGADGSEGQEIYQYLLKTEKELSDITDVRFTGLIDKNSGVEVDPCYPVRMTDDTYGDGTYVTFLVDSSVDLTNLAPVFETPAGINLYTDGSPEKSGDRPHDFSKGAIHYTAGSESKKEQQNYWLQVVRREQGGGRIYINSLNDPEAHTREEGGIIYSAREMVMDGRYNYCHDILLINTGTDDIKDLKAELVSEQVELDPYWTLKGNQVLLGFNSLQKVKPHGELQNFAKLRIKPKEGVEKGDISGTLTISSAGNVLMVLTLTGTIGDPYITTTEIPPAVKYVPYAVMIQNNNKYDFNKVSYYFNGGTLPEGMRIYRNGELYGVPMETGTFTFTVRMDNSFKKFKSSVQTLTLTVKENTDLNVYNESDAGYTITDHVGTEAGAGSRDFLVTDITHDDLYVSTGEYGDFIDLWLNGEKLVDGVDYVKESGSTRMTIRSQTFSTKARSGRNTLAAEFRVGGSRDNELKRTSQNFRIDTSQSSNSGNSGRRSSSGGSGSSPTSKVSYDSKKGNVHSEKGIITGQGRGYSHWTQDEKGWKLIYANGTTASGHMTVLENGNSVEQILWEKINGAWYAFGVDGYLKSGWVFDYQLNSWYNVSVDTGMQSGWYIDNQDQYTYYLEPGSGNLAVGWKKIDGKWYYFNHISLSPTWELNPETGNWYYNMKSRTKPFGAMYKGERTPDGYYVDPNGVWDGKEK